MKSIVRGGGHGRLVVAATLLLAGCGSVDGNPGTGPVAPPEPEPARAVPLVEDGPTKIGAAYTVGGVTYTPADVPDYDDVGYASWYSDELAGKPTANGEAFNPDAITAAHKTLPLPSYVEVTALDTGRTILVRVNDRGPMTSDRLIDLSRGAAQQLGLKPGITGVRVRRTNPPEAERAQLRAGLPVPERLDTPDSLLVILRGKLGALPKPALAAATQAKPATAAAPQARTKPGDDRFIVEGPGAKSPPTASAPPKPAPGPAPAPTASGSYAVQVATFSSEARANATAKAVGGSVSKAESNLWRVRIGPFASEAEAQPALDRARAKGFGDALVVHDR